MLDWFSRRLQGMTMYLHSFRKGKEACWKVWDIEENTMDVLEEYVCLLYGYQQSNVNVFCKKLFDSKYLSQNKVVDISLFLHAPHL